MAQYFDVLVLSLPTICHLCLYNPKQTLPVASFSPTFSFSSPFSSSFSSSSSSYSAEHQNNCLRLAPLVGICIAQSHHRQRFCYPLRWVRPLWGSLNFWGLRARRWFLLSLLTGTAHNVSNCWHPPKLSSRNSENLSFVRLGFLAIEGKKPCNVLKVTSLVNAAFDPSSATFRSLDLGCANMPYRILKNKNKQKKSTQFAPATPSTRQKSSNQPLGLSGWKGGHRGTSQPHGQDLVWIWMEVHGTEINADVLGFAAKLSWLRKGLSDRKRESCSEVQRA